MAGNITEYDVEVALEQMEAMKLKVVLLQDFNDTAVSFFDMNKFKTPIMKYHTDKQSKFVRR